MAPKRMAMRDGGRGSGISFFLLSALVVCGGLRGFVV